LVIRRQKFGGGRAAPHKRVGGGLIAACIMVSWATIASGEPLRETLQLVVDTHPTILEAVANSRTVAQELSQATRQFSPTIDVEMAAGLEWTNNNTTRRRDTRGPNDSPGVWLTRKETSLTLLQKVFDGFLTESEIKRQAARLDSTRYRVRERVETIGLETVQGYLDVLRSQEINKLAKENLTTHSRYMAEIQERVDGGQSGISDIQQTTSRTAAAQAVLSETFKALDEAKITYRRIVDQEPSGLVLPEFDDENLPFSLEEAINVATTSHPKLHLSAADLDSAREEIDKVQADFYPSVDLELGTTRNFDIDGTRGVNQDFSAMMVMKYNLYRGGAGFASIEEARERLVEFQERFLLGERLVKEEVRRAWNNMERSKDRMEALEQEALSNAQVVSSYDQEFQIGQRELIDLLDAENQLFNSETQLITARYTYLFSKYRVLASTGRLASRVGVGLPVEVFGSSRRDYEVKREWRPEIEESPKEAPKTKKPASEKEGSVKEEKSWMDD
jgi:adhesin transport system outer membrane protein